MLQDYFKTDVCCAYHVHDLDQDEGELDGESLGVVGHRPLHGVVVFEQLREQEALLRALHRHCVQARVDVMDEESAE